MGFKEAFTRQGEGENLLFDDDAFFYFAISILSIIIVPLVFTILKPLFKTYVLGHDTKKFARVQKSENDQQNMKVVKEELRFKWFTFGYVFKIFLLLVLLILLNASIQQLPNADKIKGFDPYEILEIDATATEQEIRKAYRKISLRLHPDKNPDDPQANQKFIMLTKAYECLTDADKKSLCMKYGNPDGQQTLSVGIAMPSFLLKKENRAAFLAVIFLVLLVVVPIIVLSELKSIGKYDDNGVLLSNMEKFERGLEENLLIRKGIILASVSDELCRQRVKSQQEQVDLNKLVKDLIEEAELRKIQNFEVTEALEQTKKQKSKRKVFISIAMLLIYGHLFGKPIPQSLKKLYRETIQIVPKLVNSMVKISLQFSNKSVVNNLRRRGRLQTRFMGLRCINNLLQFSQCIIQGLHESDNPINQISFFANKAKDYIKRGKLPVFQELIQKEQRVLPAWVPEEFKEEILNELDMFPQLEIKHEIIVDDDQINEQCIEDLINVKITLTRLNTQEGCDVPFVHSNRFTYLKEEAWHLLITFQDQVFHYAQLNGNKRVQVSEFKFVPAMIFGDQNEFELTLSVISDCYRGLDTEIPIKFSLKKTSQVKRSVEFHKEDQELDKSLPFIQSMLNPMNNQNDNDTDSEEEEEQQKKEEEQ